MNELLKLIEEYGNLEKDLGKALGINETLCIGVTDEVIDLSNRRTEKFIEISQLIIKLNLVIQKESNLKE